jgi:2-polyprenyl-3-methyl-5-hydroxy-6-metoxy-1,4-benzoquinol methylase
MALPDLRFRAEHARELMDEVDADPRMLDRTYARFRWVNSVVGGWGGIYRRLLRPRISGRTVRVLDIGSGGGDIARSLAARVGRDTDEGVVVALDADPRATAWAEQQAGPASVRYRTGTAADLVVNGEQFDVIVSNHLLHHVDDPRPLLHDTEALLRPGGIAVHADIARSRTAYALFGAATWPLQSTLLAGSFIRADGLTSIRRSRTVAELEAIAPPGWAAISAVPCRALLVKGGADV